MMQKLNPEMPTKCSMHWVSTHVSARKCTVYIKYFYKKIAFTSCVTMYMQF